MDADEGDPLENLIRELRNLKDSLAALEPALSRKIRTGSHEDLQQELAHELGVAPEDLSEAFDDEEPEPETTLLRRLRTGEQ